jgi:hypothetical protein
MRPAYGEGQDTPGARKEDQGMERKFKAQDKYKSQEKRVEVKNKEIREMKETLQCNKLEVDHDLIEKLRADKRELQVKIDALTMEV